MPEEHSQLEELTSALKQQRDHLKVKVHLGEMEAKEEFERLSKRIDELLSQYQDIKGTTETSAENVYAALSLAGEELKHGLGRVVKAIRKSE